MRRLTLAALSWLLLAAAPALGADTTTDRTIADCDGDNLLESAPGEPHVPADAASPGGADPCPKPTTAEPHLPRTASLLNILQLSDFQMVDEESPGRVEFLDGTQRAPGLNPFSAAYRPQESLTTQVTEAMVRQARNTTSPVTGAPLDLTMLTGDNADSQQYNETRWFIDLLDGTTGSRDPDPEMDVRGDGSGRGDHQIVPDSGLEAQVAGCGAAASGYRDNGSPYDGVRGGGRPGPDQGYYEPDGSSGTKDDGDGYSPDRARNQAEVPGPQADVTVRDFPGLLEGAQKPFEAQGLGMPWYSAFGNHDALVQGNSPEAYAGPSALTGDTETVDPAFDALVRGCLKPTALPAGVSPEDFAANPGRYVADSQPAVVPPDPRRCHVAKDAPQGAAAPCDSGGWIQQHSRTAGEPVGHGFEPFRDGAQQGEGRPASAREHHDGYYAFRPRPGFRFLVLDTITDECGTPVCSEGSIDDAQYRWIEDEITKAEAAHEDVMVFSHHTERTIRLPSTDPGEQPLHYGERVDRRSSPPQPVRPDATETLEDLLCRHPNVLAHVDGHEHQNYVLQHRCEDPGQAQNPYTEISTAAHIDWPQQSRMIEVVEDGGKLSLVLTMLDQAGAPNPGGPPPGATGGMVNAGPLRLASVARELAYNDYQGSRGARGERTDRNVVVPTGKAPPPSG
jgi:3',5'-cyclic AMP phosphodiesterase CpdA